MAISARYEQYDINSAGKRITTQSIVECRLNDWSENKILAVNASVALTGSEVLSGEIRYGGKIYFSVLAATPEGGVTGAERAAEFSHKCVNEEAAPALNAEVRLKVEKVEVRLDGKAVVLSAIVSATAQLVLSTRVNCLAGGDGIVVKTCETPVRRIAVFSENAEVEEEFETDYVGDILSHSESAYVTRVSCGAGSVDVAGEIELGILAKRAGEKELVSYERLIPFRTEIPCDEADSRDGCDATVCVRSVNISASCDEDKNKCAIVAEIALEISGKVYLTQQISLCEDAFSPSCECAVERARLTYDEQTAAFIATERVSGNAALMGKIDFSCNMQAVTAQNLEITGVTAEDGQITAEGVLSATVLFSDGEGLPSSVQINLPFAFPVKCDKAQKGDRVRIDGIVCGVYARQKKEGELEAEGTLKMFVRVYSPRTYAYVCGIEGGEEIPENECAISVYIPEQGDGLWEVAKKLKKPPEEVSRCNAELEYPLCGDERIVIYRRKTS